MSEILCEKCIEVDQKEQHGENNNEHKNEINIKAEFGLGRAITALAKCLDCNNYLCSNCLIKHQLNNNYINHQLISLNEKTNEIESLQKQIIERSLERQQNDKTNLDKISLQRKSNLDEIKNSINRQLNVLKSRKNN